MNSTPDSDPTVAPPPAGGFFAWIRNLGIVRGDERWFAGVAGGIAAKANIDPLIVRGVFVVLALLGGPGVLLYLAGWLLLPDLQGRIHVEEIIRGRAQTGVLITAIVITAVIFIPVVFGMLFAAPFTLWGWDGWSLLGIPDWLSATIAWMCWINILIFAGIWLRRALLERGRKQRTEASGAAASPGSPASPASPAPSGGETMGSADEPEPPATPYAFSATPQNSAAAGADDWGQRVGEKAGEWGERAGEAAGRWGENLSKQADDWSAKYTEHHEAHKLGAAHTIISIAFALLVGGLAALWVSNSGAFSDVSFGGPAADGTTPVAIVAALIAALAVLAVSLIVAGVRGRSTGWVGFLAACGVVALLFTAVLPWGTRVQPFGTLQVEVLNEPGAVLLAGNARIDLSALDTRESYSASEGATADNESDVDLTVWQLTGNATVTLPSDHPTVVSVYLLAGNIGEQQGDETRNAAGPFLSKRVTANLGAEGPNAADVARIDVFMLAGNVRVVSDRTDSSVSDEAQRNIEADTRSTTSPESDGVQDQRALERELDRVEWQLDEPGLSDAERRTLETERAQLTRDLERLDMEVAR